MAVPVTSKVESGDTDDELEELLQFFYQCPVGLIEIDDGGEIGRINPAAVRMLAGTIADDGLHEVFGLFERLCPALVETITADHGRLGTLDAGFRVAVPDPAGEEILLELSVVRVDHGRIMITVVDVSGSRQPPQREHEPVDWMQQSALPSAVRARLEDLLSVADEAADELARQGMRELADRLRGALR